MAPPRLIALPFLSTYILPRTPDLSRYRYTKARNEGTCYCTTIGNGQLASNDTLRVCGPPNQDTFQQCCKHGDTCGIDGFCYSPSSDLAPSPVYLGGCTDPQYQDVACPKSCASSPSRTVFWRGTDQGWSCCAHSDASNCTGPESTTFQAGDPSNLFVEAKVVNSVSAVSLDTTMAAASATAGLTAAASPTPQASNKSSLAPALTPSPAISAAISATSSASSSTTSSASKPTPPDLGIGIGVVSVAAALALLTLFFFVRRWHLAKRRAAFRTSFERGPYGRKGLCEKIVVDTPTEAVLDDAATRAYFRGDQRHVQWQQTPQLAVTSPTGHSVRVSIVHELGAHSAVFDPKRVHEVYVQELHEGYEKALEDGYFFLDAGTEDMSRRPSFESRTPLRQPPPAFMPVHVRGASCPNTPLVPHHVRNVSCPIVLQPYASCPTRFQPYWMTPHELEPLSAPLPPLPPPYQHNYSRDSLGLSSQSYSLRQQQSEGVELDAESQTTQTLSTLHPSSDSRRESTATHYATATTRASSWAASRPSSWATARTATPRITLAATATLTRTLPQSARLVSLRAIQSGEQLRMLSPREKFKEVRVSSQEVEEDETRDLSYEEDVEALTLSYEREDDEARDLSYEGEQTPHPSDDDTPSSQLRDSGLGIQIFVTPPLNSAHFERGSIASQPASGLSHDAAHPETNDPGHYDEPDDEDTEPETDAETEVETETACSEEENSRSSSDEPRRPQHGTPTQWSNEWAGPHQNEDLGHRHGIEHQHREDPTHDAIKTARQQYSQHGASSSSPTTPSTARTSGWGGATRWRWPRVGSDGDGDGDDDGAGDVGAGWRGSET